MRCHFCGDHSQRRGAMLGEVLQKACDGKGVAVAMGGAGELPVPICQRRVLSRLGRRNASSKAGAGRAGRKPVLEGSSTFIFLGSCRASLP